jgi:hypothetical protein
VIWRVRQIYRTFYEDIIMWVDAVARGKVGHDIALHFEDAGEMRDLSTPALAVGAWSDQGFVEIAREQRQPV